MLSIDKYIEQVLQRVEINKEDHKGLKLELTSYLNENKESYIRKGYTDSAATAQAIQDFGDVDEIGKSLSKSLFPQRTFFMYLLGITSIIFTLLVTVVMTMQDIKVSSIWLGTTALLSLLTFTLTKRQLFIARYRVLFIFFCLVYIFPWFYGLLLLDVVEGAVITWVLNILAFSFIMVLIVNMVLGSIFQPIKKHFKSLKMKNRIFIVTSNLISGIFVVGYTLLILFGFMIFGAADPIEKLSPVLVSMALWVCSLLLSSYRPTLALLSVGIQLFVCAFIISGYVN